VSTPVTLTAALTGPIATKADNPALPVTPEEIATSGADAAAAGAAVLHVHLRDQDGRPTADLEVARRVVAAIAERTDALIQLSTGVGLAVEFEERARLVEARPAMATLNVCSMSFGTGEFRNPPDGVRRLAARMRDLGVKPELEIYDTGHLAVALRLCEEGLLEEPLQFSIVLGVRGGMSATPQDLMSLVSKMPETAVWQVVAIGASNLTLTTIGLALGANARTGLEDTLLLRRGEPAESNAQLVTRLAAVAHALERPITKPSEAAEMLGLTSRSTPAVAANGDPSRPS
jgi:3-keto-5-aminohexanoate cleavage enzyme